MNNADQLAFPWWAASQMGTRSRIAVESFLQNWVWISLRCYWLSYSDRTDNVFWRENPSLQIITSSFVYIQVQIRIFGALKQIKTMALHYIASIYLSIISILLRFATWRQTHRRARGTTNSKWDKKKKTYSIWPNIQRLGLHCTTATAELLNVQSLKYRNARTNRETQNKTPHVKSLADYHSEISS